MVVHLKQTKAALMGGAATIGAVISELLGGWDAAIMTLLIFGARLCVGAYRCWGVSKE